METVTGGRLVLLTSAKDRMGSIGTAAATSELERMRVEFDREVAVALLDADVKDFGAFKEMLSSPTKSIGVDAARATLKVDQINTLLRKNVLSLRGDRTYCLHARHIERYFIKVGGGGVAAHDYPHPPSAQLFLAGINVLV